MLCMLSFLTALLPFATSLLAVAGSSSHLNRGGGGGALSPTSLGAKSSNNKSNHARRHRRFPLLRTPPRFQSSATAAPKTMTTQLEMSTVPSSSTKSSPPSPEIPQDDGGGPSVVAVRVGPVLENGKSNDSSGAAVSAEYVGGEENASWFSRFFFRFVTPLLRTAQERNLNAVDAFPVSANKRMDRSVPDVTEIYQNLQEEHFQRQGKRKNGNGRGKETDRQSRLLFRALLQHQKPLLIRTGLLRLLSTAVQAFPAMLLARLLRSVETGRSKSALQTALALISLLMVKIVVENQFFHQIITLSTQVRGSLAGMIFDKSLRLPAGAGAIAGEEKNNNNQDGNKKSSYLGTGGVLNLMQSDAGIVELAALQFHTTWDAPLQISIYVALLLRYLGPSVLWGIALLLLTIPMNSVTLRILRAMSEGENRAKDARTKRTAESVAHMNLLKLQGWQGQFARDIRADRNEELSRHSTRGIVRAINNAISNAVPSLVLVVTLSAYVKMTGGSIQASKVFTAISLFNQLRFPLWFYPNLIDSFANGQNAMKRISTYLATQEAVPYVEQLPPLVRSGYVNDSSSGANVCTGGSIELKHGNFLWSSTSSSSTASASSGASENSNEQSPGQPAVLPNAAPALIDAELKVNPGEVVAVVGSVGNGKTALIKALLGELNPVPRTIVQQAIAMSSSKEEQEQQQVNWATTGDAPLVHQEDLLEKPTVIAHGGVAYCSQEAWLPKGTIRDAIVFGREYSEKRYKAAIRDAGLDADIVDDDDRAGKDNRRGSKTKKVAVGGALSHDTDVGEGGSSLSGGQRARVALARALYGDDDGSTTKIFLLDDCLAALDAAVGSTVFERVTRRLRKSNAATVLVTNDPSIPRRCDRVVLMQKVPSSPSCSSILDVGTYDELLARGHKLRTISEAEAQQGATPRSGETDQEGITATVSTVPKGPAASSHHEKKKKGRKQRAKQLQVANRKSTIRVVGGYEVPANGTDECLCHADPDGTLVMANCPEYETANRVIPAVAETDDMIRIEGPVCYQNNGTMLAGDDSASPGQLVSTADTGLQQSKLQEPRSDAKETEGDLSSRKTASADDTMSTGAVPLSTYVSYFKAVRSPLMIIAMLASFLVVNSAQLFQQYTVAKWTEVGTGSMATALGAKYLRDLVRAAGVVSIFLWLRSYLTMKIGVRASEFLHSRMLSSVFSAPMSFFDATPSGQLLSRFGKEMETVDRGVPDSIQSVVFCFLSMFMSIGALAGVITPTMMIPLFLIGTLYAKNMSLFRRAARDMKRAETKTRSPIYTHFGEALRGTETIRSIKGARNTWSSKHRSLSDANLGVFLTVKSFDRWLTTRLETLGNGIIFTAAVASVGLSRMGRLQAGSAGWGLTQSLAITNLLTWAVRCLSDLETHMMSVLRVQELTTIDSADVNLNGMEPSTSSRTKTITKEAAKAGDALVPLMTSTTNSPLNASLAPLATSGLVKDGWPWRGNVEFSNVSMRYNPAAPLVLKGVTLSVPAGTTLGVVGRTGSGKSSLLLTLFRLAEIEAGGAIEIDGVDIRSVDLDSLRQSLAIIPQNPVLFAGTIAYNLDATEKSSPADMWAALEAAAPSLAEQFRNAEGLDTYISEGGKNLSLGQRQLICLARALIRNSKILVLDEATSSVDSTTDQEVQATIRREFVKKGATVITVAHRLDTVLGYDRIAVLGDGRVLEYGPPGDLLRIPRGELRSLVDADIANKMKGARRSPLPSAVGA